MTQLSLDVELQLENHDLTEFSRILLDDTRMLETTNISHQQLFEFRTSEGFMFYKCPLNATTKCHHLGVRLQYMQSRSIYGLLSLFGPKTYSKTKMVFFSLFSFISFLSVILILCKKSKEIERKAVMVKSCKISKEATTS